ncbi:MAG: hypothetical protein HQL19_02090 [Candidatus Omnitrophica bacterium]|nr:hypothetical protein [Candidatus Omnitrophota bacterium]
MKKYLMGVVVVLALACSFKLAVAQDNAEEDKFSFGKIVSVAADQITVKEYDFTKDADVETSYAVTAETELGNINAVKDLVAGDDIVIDYVEKDGKRVVTTLVKEEKGAETPGAPADAAPAVAAPAAAVAVPAAAPAEVVPAAVPAVAPVAAAPVADAAAAPVTAAPADAPAQK